jgi:hypothetical protein
VEPPGRFVQEPLDSLAAAERLAGRLQVDLDVRVEELEELLLLAVPGKVEVATRETLARSRPPSDLVDYGGRVSAFLADAMESRRSGRVPHHPLQLSSSAVPRAR